ncbi:MAG: ATP-binding protein [Proteobacteria bacterium]|nr:ATP-binding protein [Pseudomonadota bacterium]
MIPTHLAQWTLETLERLCATGQAESDRHDFKHGLQDSKGTTKLACAFANTFGGFIVLGVQEKGAGFIIVGMEPDKELYSKFVSKIKIEPDISIATPQMISIPGTGRFVYVFEIPTSLRRPHPPSPADWRVFWKRSGSDCVQMTLEEIRSQMVAYEEKREKLALLSHELRHILRSIEEISSTTEMRPNNTMFHFDVIDRVMVESYAIIKADQNLFGAIDTLKKLLMNMNAETQHVINTMTLSYSDPVRLAATRNRSRGAQNALSHATILAEQINRSLRENFGVEIPL